MKLLKVQCRMSGEQWRVVFCVRKDLDKVLRNIALNMCLHNQDVFSIIPNDPSTVLGGGESYTIEYHHSGWAAFVEVC